MRLMAMSLFALFAVSTAAAEPAATGASSASASFSERMTPLAGLEGEWSGSGWMLLPNGNRETFNSRETVSRRLSGAALLVEGQHRSTRNGEMVHDAMAMIVWDPRASTYRIRTALANGMSGDYPLEVTANGFAWRMDTPGGRIDYVAEVRGDTWVERGRRTGADGRSVDFFEMTLRRRGG